MARPKPHKPAEPETTGHEWDGIHELNKPLPKWWLWTFYATIVWAVGYWIVYPAWPTVSSYSKGVLGYSQRGVVAGDLDAAKAAKASFRDKIAAGELADIVKDPELLRFALAGGEAAFGDNCAPCHGRGAQGAPGYPNLRDDSWLWGDGTLDAIHKTILVGIRADHPDTQLNQMPAFGRTGVLTEAQIDDLAEFVLSLSGDGADETAAQRGAPLFAANCVACHGEGGKGNAAMGAPDLADALWLYAGDKAAVMESIRNGRGGVMPAWVTRLDREQIKELAIYVHSLGGGR